MNEEMSVIVKTAIAVSVTFLGAGMFVLRAVIAQQVEPLNKALTTLTSDMKGFTEASAIERELRREERAEMRAMHKEMDQLVRDLDRRVAVIERIHPPSRSHDV